MNPFRLALLAGLLFGVPIGGWILSLLAAAPEPSQLRQAALVLVLLQLLGVILTLQAFSSAAAALSPHLLLFLIPAPLAVPIVLADDAGAGFTALAQITGLLLVAVLYLASRLLALFVDRGLDGSGLNPLSVLQAIALFALLLVAAPLLAWAGG
ncbi:hypothetical protein [Thiohalocapsa sp. ML1]|jgi:hypothetical protein|uniref:hypothetical protein n=1 Tax=Thiohalocapsa sp. ML1 TaxID=1431688 RepID=UPI000731FE26|nr:hypothetical protein [Thiohalocapsa sp. ML1]